MIRRWQYEPYHYATTNIKRIPAIFLHPDVDKINYAIMEGQSIDEVAMRFGLPPITVRRYMKRVKLRDHPDIDKILKELRDMDMPPEQISDNLPAHRVYGGTDVIGKIQDLLSKAEALGAKAETEGNINQAISALREQYKILESLMKMAERMRRSGEFDPWQHPDVVAYQEGLLEILKKHPKVLEAVIEYIDRYNSRVARSGEERDAVPIRPDLED